MRFKTSWDTTKKMFLGTFNGFLNDRGLKLSASLAYYTLFSLAPLLILMISLASVFYGAEASQGKIFSQINELVGKDAALQIQSMITSVNLSGKTTVALVTGILTLLIGASSTFVEIQDSINIIWGVKAKPKSSWVAYLKNRLLTSSLIVGLAFLLIVSLLINGLILALSDRLASFMPGFTIVLVNIVNTAITFIVITVLFGTIFKILPDVKIKWRNVYSGAIFTSLLFMLGKYLIGVYISVTHQGSTYGAAGSIIILLLWIYYTSAILYFGAEFTRTYADHFNLKIEPADYAVLVEQREIEKPDVQFIPPKLGDESLDKSNEHVSKKVSKKRDQNKILPS